jgi:hypothetical protein
MPPNLDRANPASPGGFQLISMAEGGDVNAMLFARFEDGLAKRD